MSPHAALVDVAETNVGLLYCCACGPMLLCSLQGLGLVFVAVYQKTLSLMYVDELLALVRDAFTDGYSPSSYNYEAFGSKFNKILRDCEARADAARRNAAVQQVMTEVGKFGAAWHGALVH
jgi:hypothetical protein